VLAVPLRGDRQDDADAVGLLLVKAGTSLTGDVNWLATVLGQRLDQIRGRGSMTEELRKLRRERALFFTIINSVTDPIMLTDTEGRLIVANSRAEKLFAATEEESEGPPPRRRVEQHAVLGGAVAHGRGGALGGAASCCWWIRATVRTCCSRC
jgi:PAS domain-containing protein